MTKLSVISGHLIWIECTCGHHSSVAVADLLARLPGETTVAQVIALARCKNCSAKGAVKLFRIVFKSS